MHNEVFNVPESVRHRGLQMFFIVSLIPLLQRASSDVRVAMRVRFH